MFELLIVVLFIWLFAKAIGLAVRVTWTLAKVFAVILFVLALPTLIGCFLTAGGFTLLIPLLLVAAAFGILQICT